MMKKILTFIMAAALLTVWSCDTAVSRNDELTAAEQAVDTHNYRGAQTACDRLLEQSAGEPLSAAQYGRLSLLFMRLSEIDAEHENVGQATQCYLKAFAADADSARAYYSSLPLEMSSYVEMMASLSRAITSPADISDDSWCETDSIPATDSHEH